MSSIPATTNNSYNKQDKYTPIQPTYNNNEGGVASIMLSCCAPTLRASPTNTMEYSRGSNIWSEKEFGNKKYKSMNTNEVLREYPPVLGCHTEGGRMRPSKPFASNPLLDRDDPLQDEGMLSLVASECETKRNYDEEELPSFLSYKKQPREERNKTKPFQSSPLITRDDSLAQDGSLLSLIASQEETINQDDEPKTPKVSYAKYNSRLLQKVPSGDGTSLQQLNLPPSPAMELSMAKQQATQMMGKLSMRRDLSRVSFPKVDSIVGGASVATRGVRDLSSSEERSMMVELVPDCGVVSIYDILKEASAPIWSENDNIHPELKGTYCHPRLLATDPVNVIGNNTNVWWYRLSKQMDTTLPHVFDSYWQELEIQQQEDCGANDTVSNDTGPLTMSNNNHPCSPDAIVDLCSDNTPNRLRRIQQHQGSTLTSSARESSFVGSLSEVSPVNVWSEPGANSMKVRGKNYTKDGIKVESETALFACLGVDSFVSGEGAKEYSNTTHYLERWNKVCADVGLDRTPFLLVINFVVPWGHFQSYSFRPDADDGPFSSRCRNRPSEKAWRDFMNGDTEYRNKCLKLIPRVCAGPWVVKKMVGSTPALIGTKLPVTYRGSLQENYLEITMDVTKGPAFGNTVANTVVGKADVVTVDLGFVIEGQENNGTLPEQMLSLVRLHHLEMKKACNVGQWREEVNQRQSKRR